MSRYNGNFKPDVAIPQDDPAGMERLIVREFTAYGLVMMRGAADSYDEAGQCEANFNDLLDKYPLGQPRNPITLDEAHRRARGEQEATV